MRTLRIADGCRGSNQVHAVCPVDKISAYPGQSSTGKGDKLSYEDSVQSSSSSVSKLSDPPLDPYLKPVDYVDTLAEIYEQLETAAEVDKATLYLEQACVFRGLGETKLLRRSLRSARQHAVTVHEKLVYAAWLKYEKRDEELNDGSPNFCSGRKLECLQTLLTPGLSVDLPTDPCACRCPPGETSSQAGEYRPYNSFVNDIVFHLGGDAVPCNREKIAGLSMPFNTMLNGVFLEARMCDIGFSKNGISVTGMRAVDHFSKTGRLARLSPEMLLEILSFANRFCCDTLKDACDQNLATFVRSGDDVMTFFVYALEECAKAVVGACLQVFFRELPGSLKAHRQIIDTLCTAEGRAKFARVGHSSFALYAFLSQISLEESMCSDRTVSLLDGQRHCAVSQRQKSIAFHQLGCVLFARKQYQESLEYFEAAVEQGHVYSWAGIARIKRQKGQKAIAYDECAAIVANYRPSGWMFQERALCSDDKDKLADLVKATELDPTLAYPYKYRAAALMDEQKVHAAITEINRILGFKVTSDCLELRAYFCLALQEYEGAVRDVRALLTLDPSYMMYAGRVGANQLLRLLSQHVEQWSKADCWMQLYDRWSSVDDIGSLAVVHQMLESDPRKGLLFFRQSLLLLRLNCPKAAMRSLRKARDNAGSDHERLVYEGWILYDTGHREEALQKAEESIAYQRSFEAFFLKAYALADTSLDPSSSAKVVELLEEALKCPSDGLRKGQALNNLGSVYVDCNKFKLAADCYVNALKIRHTRAHQGLARVYALQGDRKAAHEEMTRLIEKARNNASAYEKRSEYCERDMTMADLSMVTQLDPLRTYPYRYRAAVLMDGHKEREAIMELSKAIAFKADLQLLHLRAAFHDCNEDFEGAKRDCRAALSVDPSHSDTLELHNKVMNRAT
ncbi:ethylene-overproduction protein 1 [Physcomitrium patens]|uniref:Ethylene OVERPRODUCER1-like protein n=1 Tax=Physcomitrium patens TaxID=3218 RepID=A0A2K1JUS6_PHYPA|nr:ethylene-overproduction protein 1-like [Physcomitrium patens]XP_024388746.1 ethylene-overproduction protein 1-like [Physcomitrium patens]PNR45278.1 hypothetical protein PHYPA_015049 [Physcomitrium patens]|eukprot:XP_024388745.1 ethylene-overproduction protein 1-like [Physcomitrella patens]